MAANSELSLRGLTNHLVAAGFNQQLLPDRARMSRGLLNHNPPVKSPFSRAVPPRAELMKRSVDQWPGAKSINAGEPDACFPKLGPLFVQPSKERRVCVCVCVCVCVIGLATEAAPGGAPCATHFDEFPVADLHVFEFIRICCVDLSQP